MRILACSVVILMAACTKPASIAAEPQLESDMMTEPVPADAGKDSATTLLQLQQEIRQLIGQAPADSLAQCKKVAFGYKACGGPAAWLVYSTAHTDEGLLLEKIARFNALAKAESDRLGMISDCAIVPEPTVLLRDGMCQAGHPGQASEL